MKTKRLFNRKKNGFTLVELLAVIVILGVIMVITVSSVMVNTAKAKEESFKIMADTISDYLKSNYKYCKMNKYSGTDYDTDIFNTDCTLRENISDDLIKNSGYSKEDIESIEIEFYEGQSKIVLTPNPDGDFSNVSPLTTGIIVYKPNPPDISNGLVPVKYDETNSTWVITNEYDYEWYDYDEQRWANAVILKNKSKTVGDSLNVDGTEKDLDIYAMFVWIPRFSYTIGCLEENNDTRCVGYKINGASNLSYSDANNIVPGAIDISFVPSNVKESSSDPSYTYTIDSNGMPTADRTPSNWYTHPAFTFDGKELSGIWVGKFETSVNQSSTCYTNLINKSTSASDNCQASKKDVTPRILPNVLSLRYQNVYNQFETAKKFTGADPNLKCGDVLCNVYYGLTNKTDSHMMKNSEWGAVTYLSHSKYGKYGNFNYSEGNKEIYQNNSKKIYTGRSSGKTPVNAPSDDGTCKYNEAGVNREVGTGLCGPGASTTGNIYGIYDMSGGSYEYVMGYYEKAYEGTTNPWGSTISSNNAGFSEKPESKYFDGYQNDDIFTKKDEVIGHAAYETRKWYEDAANNISNNNPWILRSAVFNNSTSGIFYSSNKAGGLNQYYSFRSVLIVI